jgi:hypothetical protein
MDLNFHQQRQLAMAAGSGCDSAPYFRIFNQFTQAEKLILISFTLKDGFRNGQAINISSPSLITICRERCIKTFNAALKNR